MINCSENFLEFSPIQNSVIFGLTILTCCLSILGSALIIFTYYYWKDIRSPLRSLLLYLSITDFLSALGYIVGISFQKIEKPGLLFDLCLVQSFITSWASLASFMWTMSIAIYLYFVITKRHDIALKLLNVFHVLCWGFPLILVCFAMGFNALGFDFASGSMGWCWVSFAPYISWPPWPSADKSFFWKLIAGKGIEILTYIFTPIVYISSKRALHSKTNSQSIVNVSVRTTLQDTDRKLVLIPIIFVCLRIWGTIRLLFGVYCPKFMSIYALAILQSIGDSSQGWANCVLFCFFTKKIRDKIMHSLTHTTHSSDDNI